ncbi:MAG: transglutaminase domain-containing protein, partial [Clostridia bacterium]|nr:transglutaminase domain-containing protein [Clostridia bacterium]
MKHNSKTADFAGTKNKKIKKPRKTRARKAAEEQVLLPIHKRPIVCPPDKAGRTPLFRLGGLICRALVIWLAAAGLVIFISSALEFGVSNAAVFLTALAVVTLGMIFRLGGIWKWLSSLVAVGAVGGLVALNPRLPLNLYYGLLSMYNAALDRLYKVGYLAYVQYKAPISSSTPHEELMVAGVCLLTLLVTVLFTACFARKVKIVPPAIVATTFLVVLLTFNIYSNRIESNLGITLVIVSFASMLVMAAYDRLYHGKDRKAYDTELKLFEDTDRPTMPPEYEAAMAARRDRKKSKAEMRRKRREHAVTMEDELTDYFGSKKKKPVRTKADPAAKKAEKKARKAMMKQVRAVKAYDRITEQSRTAMGGFAAAAVLLACLIAIALPSMLIKGNFNTIAAIDEKMELARNYVTALLRGDDNELDRLEYKADSDNFEPHSTKLEQLEFTGKQMFYIQSRYNMNYYFRGWVGTDYRDGAWLAVDEETLSEYQKLFGKDSSPSEELKYGFYHFMKPELVDDPEYTENLLTKYKGNQAYGFVNLLVSMRRVNSPSTLTYFPTSFDPAYGLMEYASTSESKLTFVNYYDGLYTGRKFNENGLAYATMAYAPIMTDQSWIARQAALQAAYNLQKEALLARSGFHENVDGSVSSYLTLMTEEGKNGLTMFVYTYKRSGEERIWRFYHDTDQVARGDDRSYVITTPYGILTLKMDGTRVVGTSVTDVGSPYLDDAGTPVDVNLVDEYDRGMTDEERAALMAFLNTEKSYGDYVYNTYLDTSDSAYIKELAATIKAQAHTERVVITEELIPDDPETEEDDSYTVQHRDVVNDRADVTLAALRNASDPSIYMQRDLLVRNVIDYIIDEMGCTYTITPDLTAVDETLDGVENFLRNTKEGYCVQFASAAALLLREMGIPVRYVEGYIGNDLTKISRDEFVYGGYIRDYQAHAWIEVWYDGVGWIQYEATPQYYVGMYGVGNTAGSTPVNPILPDQETTAPEEETTAPDMGEEETDENGSSEETTGEEDAMAAAVTRASLIGLAVLAVVVGIAAIIGTIVSRARAAEDHRQSLCAQILENGFGTNTSEEDRREMALELTDAVTGLLSYYGLSPNPGEFRDDYAERLTAELT